MVTDDELKAIEEHAAFLRGIGGERTRLMLEAIPRLTRELRDARAERDEAVAQVRKLTVRDAPLTDPEWKAGHLAALRHMLSQLDENSFLERANLESRVKMMEAEAKLAEMAPGRAWPDCDCGLTPLMKATGELFCPHCGEEWSMLGEPESSA